MYKFWILTAISLSLSLFASMVWSDTTVNCCLNSQLLVFFHLSSEKQEKRMKGMETSIWPSPLELKGALHSSGTDYLKGLLHTQYLRWNGDIGFFWLLVQEVPFSQKGTPPQTSTYSESSARLFASGPTAKPTTREQSENWVCGHADRKLSGWHVGCAPWQQGPKLWGCHKLNHKQPTQAAACPLLQPSAVWELPSAPHHQT